MSSTTANTVVNTGRLRRSSRAPKKLSAEFSVGEVVEVRIVYRLVTNVWDSTG